MLTCPFCGAEEADRFVVEGQRFLVFACAFTPSVDPSLSDDAIREHLLATYAGTGHAYFRGMCDRLHLLVTRVGRPTDPTPSPPGPESS